MTRRRYHKGEPYQSIYDLIGDIKAGRPLYWRDKVLPSAVLRNMQLTTLLNACQHGVLTRAVLIEAEGQ